MVQKRASQTFILLLVSEHVAVFNSVQNTEKCYWQYTTFPFLFLNKITCNYESALTCFSTKENLLTISGNSPC